MHAGILGGLAFSAGCFPENLGSGTTQRLFDPHSTLANSALAEVMFSKVTSTQNQ
jgi:hypothetical protein